MKGDDAEPEPLKVLAERYGQHFQTVQTRLKRGWDLKTALLRKPHPTYFKKFNEKRHRKMLENREQKIEKLQRELDASRLADREKQKGK